MTNEPPDLRPHGDPMREKLPTGEDDDTGRVGPDTSPADIPAPDPIDDVGSDDDPGAGAD
jgi:hypothetical protein